METVAVYWEDRIKTYGFNEVAGLSFIQWSAFPEELSGLGSGMEELACSEAGMLLVLAQASTVRPMDFGLLVEARWEDRTIRRLQDILGEVSRAAVTSLSPAGLIYFHGPHFGDRYGIADAVLGPLTNEDVPILAVGCSASSIYLVLPEASMKQGREALMELFARPGE